MSKEIYDYLRDLDNDNGSAPPPPPPPSSILPSPLSKAQMANDEKAAMEANSSSLAPPDIPCSQCYGITNEVALEVYRCSDGSGPYYYHNAVLNGGPVPASIIGQYVQALPNQPCATGWQWGTIWRVDAILPAFGLQINQCVDLEYARCGTPIPESYNCSGANGIGHPNGTIWACYDPGNGTGTYSVANNYLNPLSDCIAVCQPPPPPTWDCSGPNGITLPNGITYPDWTCYDPGNGTGQHSTQGACQAVCIEPTWDCDMANHTCNLHPTGGGFYNSTNGGYQACVTACVPPESWDCDLPLNAVSGTCTDPGTGLGQYMTWQLCNDVCNQQQHVVIEEFEVSWNCEWHWTSYSQGGPNLVGNCNPVLGTSGQYSIKQNCLDACQENQAVIDDGPLVTDPCELCCCESIPTPPWACIPGTQVMAAHHLNPCHCSTLGMMDCTEDDEHWQEGYDCLPDGTCVFVFGYPTYTGANAALNLNLATGVNYPNSLVGALAYCEDSCLPVINPALCPRIRSCPCGWSHGPSTIPGEIDCIDPTSNSTMLAIEKCMKFPMPNYAPAVGDVWLNSGSYGNITWNRAVVVNITGNITTTTTHEIRSVCN